MKYAKRAVKSATIVLVMYLLAGFFGYLFRLLLARNLTPTEYGLFYAVFSFVIFFSIFSDFGLGSAVVRFIPEFAVKKRHDLIKSSIVFTFIVQFVLSTIIALIFYFSSNWLALNYFHKEKAAFVLKIFSIIFWLSCFSIFTNALHGFQKMFAYSSMNFIKIVVALFGAIIFMSFGYGIFGATYAYLLAYITVSILSVLLFMKTFPNFFTYRTKIRKDLTKKLFRFGISVTLASFSHLIIGYTDTLTLTYFKTLEDVALYNVAIPIATILIWFLAYPLSAVLLPMTSEMWSKKHIKSLQTGMETLQKYVVLLVIPLALILLSFPEIVIRVLFGDSYISAATALQILSVGMIFYSLAYINSHILLGINKSEVGTRIVGFVAILNFILNIALIPFLGIVGAATATSISYITMMVLTSLKLRKYIKIKIPIIYFIKSIALGILMIVFIYYLKKIIVLHYVLEAIVVLFITFSVYFVLALLLKMVDIKEVFKLVKMMLR